MVEGQEGLPLAVINAELEQRICQLFAEEAEQSRRLACCSQQADKVIEEEVQWTTERIALVTKELAESEARLEQCRGDQAELRAELERQGNLLQSELADAEAGFFPDAVEARSGPLDEGHLRSSDKEQRELLLRREALRQSSALAALARGSARMQCKETKGRAQAAACQLEEAQAALASSEEVLLKARARASAAIGSLQGLTERREQQDKIILWAQRLIAEASPPAVLESLESWECEEPIQSGSASELEALQEEFRELRRARMRLAAVERRSEVAQAGLVSALSELAESITLGA